MPVRRRSRLRILIAILAVIMLGLSSRRFPRFFPGFLGLYAGDSLWAMLVYLGILFLHPSVLRRTAATLALSFSLLIEISQLYHAPWIDSLRSQTLGGLILGFGFLWSDLGCYCVGVTLGCLLDRAALVPTLLKTSQEHGEPHTKAT